MKSIPLAIAFSCLLGWATPALAQAQTTESRPYTPGPWQPIALVNPRQAVKVQIINKTSAPIDYSLTTNEAPPRQLQIGGTAALTQFTLPAYLLISSSESQMSIKFNLRVMGNLITVEVNQLNSSLPGDTTLNVNNQGGIYVY